MIKLLKLLPLVTAFVVVSTAEAKSLNPNAKAKEAIEAALSGDTSKMNKIINDASFDINAQDEDGMTVLMGAALGGNSDLVKTLLLRKANLEIKNKAGETALAVALGNDQFKVAQQLIHSGANVDIIMSGDDEDTLLIRSAGNDLKTTELILKKKKSLLNKTNKANETALMRSIEYHNNKIAQLLINQGADTKIKNKGGKTALDLAKESNNQEAIKLLSAKK